MEIKWCNHDPTVNICRECQVRNEHHQAIEELSARHAALIERLETLVDEWPEDLEDHIRQIIKSATP